MKYLSLLLAIAFAQICRAADYDPQVETFLAALAKGQSSEAVDLLFSSNPRIAKNNPSGVQDVKSMIAAQEVKSGKMESWKKVGDYVVGDYYAYVTYFVCYEYQPLWIEFQFFRTKDGWRISTFTFSTEIQEEIQKRARYEVSKKEGPNQSTTAQRASRVADR